MRAWLLKHVYLARAIGLVIVLLVVLLAVVIPSWGKSAELNRSIAVRQKEENALLDKISVITNIDTEALSSRIDIINRALPPRKDVVLYLNTVDGLSRELGLSFTGISLSPGDVTEATESATKKVVNKSDLVPGVHILETEIKITGTKDSIYRFLTTIENSSPLMQVKDVKVSKIGKDEDNTFALALKLGMLWAKGDVMGIKGAVQLFTEDEERYFGELANLRNFQGVELDYANNSQPTGKIKLFEPILQQIKTLPQVETLPVESLETQALEQG